MFENNDFMNNKNKKKSLAPLLKHAMDDGKISGELYFGDWADVGSVSRLQELRDRFN